MRIAFPVLVVAVLLAGCASSRFSPLPIGRVLKDYRSVEKGMTQKQVIALLGAPDNVGRDGTQHWWVDAPEGQLPSHADLDVVFDRDGKVADATVHSDDQSDPTGPCLQLNVTIPHTAFSL